MTGDGVNDAPALSQAEVGIAVSNAMDIAKGAASVVLTHEGLAEIIELVKTGRQIHQRISTWILNKIIKTFEIVLFVVLAFLITGEYIIGAFEIVLLLFLIDFVTIAIATDNVRSSKTPESWDIASLARVAVLLAF
jgi:H+-transporting ATPase